MLMPCLETYTMKNNQLAIVDGKPFTEKDVYSGIDNVLGILNQTGDIQKATSSLIALEKWGDVVGHAKAKLLYGMWKWWEFNATANFTDYIESHSEKTKKTTIDRYITVQEMIETEQIPEDVATLPMRTLVPIAKTLSHGHKITRSQFDKIIKANNSREVEDILRTIKGKAARKSSMQIEWARDGSLYAWQNNRRTFLGYLDKEAYTTDETAQKAINRILDNTGIIRK